jgi:hypothetical protein
MVFLVLLILDLSKAKRHFQKKRTRVLLAPLSLSIFRTKRKFAFFGNSETRERDGLFPPRINRKKEEKIKIPPC